MDDDLPFGEIKIEEAVRIGVLGASGHGKTNTIRSIVKQICCEYKIAGIWWYGNRASKETWINEKFRGESVDKAKIGMIVKAQQTPAFKDYFQIVVLDDINGEDFYTRDKKFWVKFFCESSRQDRIFIIVGLQFLTGAICPPLRKNISKWVICEADIDTQKSLYGLSRVRDSKTWSKVFNHLPIGFPILMDKSPNSQHLSRLHFEKCTEDDMKK